MSQQTDRTRGSGGGRRCVVVPIAIVPLIPASGGRRLLLDGYERARTGLASAERPARVGHPVRQGSARCPTETSAVEAPAPAACLPAAPEAAPPGRHRCGEAGSLFRAHDADVERRAFRQLRLVDGDRERNVGVSALTLDEMIRLPLDRDLPFALVSGAESQRLGRDRGCRRPARPGSGSGCRYPPSARYRRASPTPGRPAVPAAGRCGACCGLPLLSLLLRCARTWPVGAADEREGDSQNEDATTTVHECLSSLRGAEVPPVRGIQESESPDHRQLLTASQTTIKRQTGRKSADSLRMAEGLPRLAC